MKQNMKSVGLTLVTAGLFLVLLIGVQYFFKNYYVADQFQEQLSQIDGVKSVEIGDKEIIITLNNVDNLKESYEQINKILAKESYQITIKDNASEDLKEMAAECEIAIQEAIFRGNFTDMEGYIKKMADDKKIEAKIFVDSQRVYLQLKSGNRFLYQITQRPNTDLTTLNA